MKIKLFFSPLLLLLPICVYSIPPVIRTEWKNSEMLGPQITQIRTEPKIIRAGEKFRVYAKITDNNGLAEETNGRKNVMFVYRDEPFAPKLKWDNTNGLLIGLDKPPQGLFGMKQISNDEFVTESEIPGLKEGAEVYYKVVAADAKGNVNGSELRHFKVYYPSKPYRSAGEFGQPYEVGQYAALDKEGQIWVCEVGKNDLRVFLQDGTESSISRISTGLDESKKLVPIKNPSGLAADKNGMIYATFGKDSNGYITQYDPTNGNPMWGMSVKYSPGDIAIDRNGNLFVIEKLQGRWHLYDQLGKEYENSPFCYDTESSLINRGIAVTENGRTVYIASDSVGEVIKFTGTISRNKAPFQPVKSLTHISGASGAVNIDNDGNIYVSDYGANCIQVFNRNEKHIADLVGGTPELEYPCGVAISRDGKTIYIVSMTSSLGFGKLQKWVKEK